MLNNTHTLETVSTSNPVDNIHSAVAEQISHFEKEQRHLSEQLQYVDHCLRRLYRANDGLQPDMPVGPANAANGLSSQLRR